MQSKLKGRCLLERVDVLKKFERKKLQERPGPFQWMDVFKGEIASTEESSIWTKRVSAKQDWTKRKNELYEQS